MPKQLFQFRAFTEIDDKNQNIITIARVGTWNHPAYGEFKITGKTIDDFVKHFKDKTRKVDIGIDVEHRSYSGYVGWFKDLYKEGNTCKAVIEWTKEGVELLKDKTYKYFSPEIAFKYEDPETQEQFENVIIGGGITNRPYFKGLKPLLASEGESNATLDDGNDFVLFLNDLSMNKYAKMFSDLSAKDKITKAEFDELKAAHAALSEEEQKTAEKPEAVEDKVEEDGAGDGKGGDDGGDAAAAAASAAADEAAKASEAKTLSEANAKLAKMSEQIAKLEKENRSKVLSEKASKMLASEANKEGAFLPKAEKALLNFFETLSDRQIDMFNELLKDRAKEGMFNEAGATGADAQVHSDGNVRNAEVVKEAEQLVKEGKFKNFSEALHSLKDKYQSARG